MKKVIKLPIVIERCGLSRSSIYDYIQKDKFPRPISIGDRAVGWLENEIDSWITERAEMRESK